MATIASLVVSLSADSGKLKTDLDKANSQTKKWAKDQSGSIKGLGSSFKDLGNVAVKVGATAAAAFTAVAAALTAGTLKVAGYAKEIDRMSKSLNIAKSDFQAWTIASQKAGIEQEKLADIFKDVNERIGEYAATGSGPLADFMDRVGKAQGIKVDDLLALPTEDRFIAIQDAMERMNLPLEEQSFIWESLASDATYLIPLLTKGGAEFEKIKSQALATGQILSDEVIGSLTKFKDNLAGIGSTMYGWGNILVSQYAPQLQTLSSDVANFLATNDTIRAGFAMTGQAIAAVLQAISDAFTWINTTSAQMVASTPAITAAWQAMGPIFDYLAQKISIAWELFKVGASVIWSVMQPSIAIVVEFGSLAVQAISAILGPLGQVEAALSGGLIAALQQAATEIAGWSRAGVAAIQTVADYAADGVEAISTSFSLLPGALADLMYQAANGVIGAVEAMINGVLSRINRAVQSMRAAAASASSALASATLGAAGSHTPAAMLNGPQLPAVGTVNLGRADNPFQGQAEKLGDAVGNTVGKRAADRINAAITAAIPDPGMVLGEFNILGQGSTSNVVNTGGTGRSGTIAPYVKPDSGKGSGGGSKGGSAGSGTKGSGYKDTYTSGDKLTDALRDAGVLDAQVPEAANEVANTFLNSFKSGFSDLLSGKSSFKDFLLGTLDSITSQIIDGFTNKLVDGFLGGIDWDSMFSGIGESAAGAFKGIGDSISGWLQGIGSGSGGGGGFLSSIGGFFSGLMGFNEGGFVPNTQYSSPNKDSVLALLQPGEYVIPVDQVKAMQDGRASGGSGQTVNLNITGDISRQTKSEILKMIPQIAAGVRGNSKELGLA